MQIYLDNNLWDYFYKSGIDLHKYFPTEKFDLCITMEGMFEITQIPEHRKPLKEYIDQYVNKKVRIDKIFGFYDPSLPKNEQRYHGFGQGRFGKKDEAKLKSELGPKHIGKKRKDSQILNQNEADVALASVSSHSVVLTFDCKKGPLQDAFNKGGKVVFLDYKKSKQFSVKEFMAYMLDKLNEYSK